MSYNLSVKHFDDVGEISLSYFVNPIITGLPGGGEKNDSSISSFSQLDNLSVEQPGSSSSADNKIRSLRRTKQMIYDLARSNSWDYFATFTFSDSWRYEYDICKKKLQKFLNNLRSRYACDLKYICIPEHHEDGAYHFHGLFADLPADLLTSSVSRPGEFYMERFPFGRNFFSPVQSSERVSNYITKYITKDYIDLPGKQRYIRSQNLNMPKKETYLIEDETLIEIIKDRFPGYAVAHTYNGQNSSTYIQLKRLPQKPET